MTIKRIVNALVLGALLAHGADAAAQGANPPHIMVLVDTSGSMLLDLDGSFTGGDGSSSVTPWGDTCCPGFDEDFNGIPDGYDSRLYIAKDVLRDAVWSVNEEEVVFGLARYWQDEFPGWETCNLFWPTYMNHGDPSPCYTMPSPPDGPAPQSANHMSYLGGFCGDTTGNPDEDSGDVLVGYAADDSGRSLLLDWIDNDEVSDVFDGFDNPELRGLGATPLAGSIFSIRDYFDVDGGPEDIVGNPCQRFAVILTDGAQSPECSDSPVDAVAALAAEGVTVYVIAFTISDPGSLATMDAMAVEGGTNFARRANSRDQLRAAFSEIIEAAIQVEVCDDADNDCDGVVDENLFRPCSTACEQGVEQCSAGSWGTCSARVPGTETCNNIDDNCDGAIDEGLTRPCDNACGPGTERCVAGTWRECTAPRPEIEVCDGVDNDCDCPGDTNGDGAVCESGDTGVDETDPLIESGATCGTDVGICEPGPYVCVDGSLECDYITPPGTETCNGLDDDCDGEPDDGVTRVCGNTHCPGVEPCITTGPGTFTWGACTARTAETESCNNVDDNCNGIIDDLAPLDCTNDCEAGTRTCVGGVWQACTARQPIPEVCNGYDDDCDGFADDGVWRPCEVGTAPGACTGFEPCIGDDIWGDCTATVVTEICNGFDDDCDGIIDNGLTRSCALGSCTGTETCTGGSWAGCTAVSTPEVCDGIDNDCDGTPDDGVTQACGNAFCPGVETCTGPGTWTGCTARTPTSETCNNVDDDCDGNVDDGIAARACSTVCGDGTETCTAGVWGGCTAPVPTLEICDGLDNDCDTDIDEGVTRACTVASCGGIQLCTGPDTWGECSVTITPEVCNGVDDDCDGDADEDIPNRPCSSVCGPGTQSCLAGAWTTCTAPTPVAETCDGTDEDCDGFIDNGLELPCSTLCGDGVRTCVDGFYGPCSAREPTDEVCDGLDNDCDCPGDTNGDGAVCESGDDGVDEDDPDLGEVCGTDVGECQPGSYICFGGILICDGSTGPAEEICDGRDNDCDCPGDTNDDGEACAAGDEGVDEGLPLGETCDCEGVDCASTGLGDTGECEWGHWICRDGGVLCDGWVGPTDEACDCLDNDCDGFIDEGLPVGDICGTNEGECTTGRMQCVDCAMVCVGNIGPRPETCNGLDDDCDGEVDEEGGDALCPQDDAACIEGQCALPCGEGEFPCPAGKYCSEGYCVSDSCAGNTCSACEFCDPATGDCVDRCTGRTCPDGTICDCGRCIPDDCYYVGCDAGQICDNGECVEDLCADVTCDENQFCRDGECLGVCTPDVECPSDEVCRDGECVADLCSPAPSCGPRERCNPETGECSDLCTDVICPAGRLCDLTTGECEDDPCLNVDCPAGARCEDGTCVVEVIGPTDSGPEGGADAGVYVLATGAGGSDCTCRAAGPAPAEARGTAALLSLLLGVGLFLRRK